MLVRDNAFKAHRAADWTRERIELLSTQEVQQLRVNADRLQETTVVSLCEEVLRARPKRGGRPAGKKLA
ncbi:MAG: hypothetical protein A3D95_08040 [Betaproteobacteria bacterium RIFCSPHIGHO2_12_FULL_69_13]|nr:MAG: hypothetical protein A3D95_08040 [Betaproteobacteria bacterium RIFCSPHIGHO2_12_FULL_69_13]OGA67442.1 MAG: hypothetical protein A3G83_17680 [Betaproteobacteria bacterium RIFCSPLOWO2_12_FULL_68_20]